MREIGLGRAKYSSSEASRVSGSGDGGWSGEDEMDIIERSHASVRLRFGGVSCAARTACVEGGKCSESDIFAEE